MTEREWKPVLGFEGDYEVSYIGDVRRVSKAQGTYPGRILHPTEDSNGYKYISLGGRKKRNKVYIHAIVLEAFKGKRPEGLVCNHIDGDVRNNNPFNLEWVTQRENARHSTRVLGRGNKKLCATDVIEIKRLLRDRILTGKSIAKMFEIDQGSISRINRGLNWSHIPWPTEQRSLAPLPPNLKCCVP